MTELEEPSPRASGISLTIFRRLGWRSGTFVEQSSAKDYVHHVESICLIGAQSSILHVPHKPEFLDTLVTATPTESKPGPTLALVAGTIIFILVS